MSASQASPLWSGAVVRAPQALGLGAPRMAEASPPPPPPPASPPAPSAAGPPAPPVAAGAPKAVRLPSGASDQEGVYECLLWVVRGLEECGRAFTRLTLKLGKVEGRLAALEDADAARRLAVLEDRVHRLEAAPSVAAAPAAAARVVPLRPDPDLATLRRELATAQVRITRLEGTHRKAERPPTELEEHVASLEQDVVGVYRELDGVAQRVDDRLGSATRSADRAAVAVADLSARVERLAAAAGGGPSSSLESRLAALEARLERAESPRSQAERLHSALEQVLGRSSAPEPAAPAVPAPLVPAPLVPAPLVPPTPPPPSPPRPWASSELSRPTLELTSEDVRNRAASVLTAELDRIRSSLGALGADVPGA